MIDLAFEEGMIVVKRGTKQLQGASVNVLGIKLPAVEFLEIMKSKLFAF